MTSQDSGIPSNRDFLWPTLQALKERGNSASKKEIEETITRQMDLSDEIMSATYETGAFIAAIRMGWARSWLKGMQLVGNAERGVWVLTPLGMRGLEGGERKLLDDFKAYKRQSLIAYKQEREKRKGKDKDIVEDENRLYEEDQRWKGALLKRLISLEPDAFERVCFAVLREYGYEIEKTGGAGDRGIDGKGILRLDNLISFDIAIQCKRYSEE
ncbi:MAG: restriction endonuclease, partial [Alphaproteobacteria bacterium GM7ARS4]|nr:restriction endonuclease [Alphaproteobacteria bacterium GM7ARS4]